jgi:hypothetical protein
MQFEVLRVMKIDCVFWVTHINYDKTSISIVSKTKFLGLIIDDMLSWKQHTGMVTNKISSACFAHRNLKYIVSFETLRLTYFAHVHSL